MSNGPTFSCELFGEIVEKVRAQASGIPTFRNRGGGGIRMTVEPFTDEARKLFNAPAEGLIEYFTSIFPDSREVITIPEENGLEVSTYGFSAMKTASAFYAIDHGFGLLSGSCGSLTYDSGYAPHLGTVVFRVLKNGKIFCDICVTVSGAQSMEDLRCSYAVKETIVSLFSSSEYAILCPSEEEIEEAIRIDSEMAIMFAQYFEDAAMQEQDNMSKTWRALENYIAENETTIAQVEKEIALLLDETSSVAYIPE